MSDSRRDFLGHAVRALLAGSGCGLLGRLHTLQEAALDAVAGAPAAEYRALVCVFLSGGNDSYNVVIPRSSADHAVYAASRGDLTVPQQSLLPITPITTDGRDWGLHPSLPELQGLFAAGRLAVVANAGPLLAPMTKAQYQNGSVRKPKQLFSHSDQTTLCQSQSAAADTGYGWAGRAADLLLSLNNGLALSPGITLAGSTRLLRGQTVIPYNLGTNGSVPLNGFSGTRGTRRLQAFQDLLNQNHGHVLEQGFAAIQNQAIELDALIRSALATQGNLATVFPDTSLGRQLRMVARMIAIRNALPAVRQVFYVVAHGWDTHSGQNTAQPTLLADLSRSLAAFQAALAEVAVEPNVTTFTLSEFGRTLSSNGQGSDHGWGGHQLVLGGAVRGREFYGQMPDLALGSANDVGRGRMLPTTAIDQYAATLAKWFGLDSAQVATVFPRLTNFASGDLGFLNP